MESRWFNIAVVLVWLSTTSWLVVAKVIPPLRRGQPPNYQSMFVQKADDAQSIPPVGWEMSLNGKPLGWALSKVGLGSPQARDTSLTDISSRIHFDRIPLAEFAPAWMTKILLRSPEPVENLQMDAISSLKIDSLGHLAEFESILNAGGFPNSIVIRGRVRASMLRGEVKTADFAYPFEIYLPGDALVSDELSPQSRLTGLRMGQEWTVPVLSPLRDPRSPVEILQATVDSRDLLMWEGDAVPVFQVIYRPDSARRLIHGPATCQTLGQRRRHGAQAGSCRPQFATCILAALPRTFGGTREKKRQRIAVKKFRTGQIWSPKKPTAQCGSSADYFCTQRAKFERWSKRSFF